MLLRHCVHHANDAHVPIVQMILSGCEANRVPPTHKTDLNKPEYEHYEKTLKKPYTILNAVETPYAILK